MNKKTEKLKFRNPIDFDEIRDTIISEFYLKQGIKLNNKTIHKFITYLKTKIYDTGCNNNSQ